MAKQRPLTARELAVMDRIESLLPHKNLTWAELARRVGKTANSGSQWSGRRSFPREQTLYTIARELGADMGWLLSGEEPSEQRAAQTTAELELLKILREMSPAERSALLAAARGIKGSLTKK